jgi:hypothetical protein
MYTRKRSIYRPESIQRYLSDVQKGVLPRLVAPRVMLFLWLLLGLILTVGAAAWFAEVPVYSSGRAVVLASEPSPIGTSSFLIVAFLPTGDLLNLRVGQTALVDFDGHSGRLANPLTAVQTQVISPVAARRLFSLDAGAAQAVAQPSAVAIAQLVRWPRETDPASYVGGVYPVDIEVGSRRLSSFFFAPTQALGD